MASASPTSLERRCSLGIFRGPNHSGRKSAKNQSDQIRSKIVSNHSVDLVILTPIFEGNTGNAKEIDGTSQQSDSSKSILETFAFYASRVLLMLQIGWFLSTNFLDEIHIQGETLGNSALLFHPSLSGAKTEDLQLAPNERCLLLCAWSACGFDLAGMVEEQPWKPWCLCCGSCFAWVKWMI